MQNVKIGVPGADAIQLNGDQILDLAMVDNPDGHGSYRYPVWLSGPVHLGYWKTFFAETVANPAMHGRIFIMVVNNVVQTSMDNNDPGQHWFLISWLIEPSIAAD